MKIEFEFSDKNDVGYMISLYLLGVISALSEGIISIYDAERAIFTPRIAVVMENLGVNPKLIKILWDGTELEDVESLVPEQLDEAITDLKSSIFLLLSEFERKVDPIESLTIMDGASKFEVI